jgi:hypothetical protein
VSDLIFVLMNPSKQCGEVSAVQFLLKPKHERTFSDEENA